MKNKNASAFRLYGIFGYPLAHTLSPDMQEAAFEKAGLKAYYLALEMEPAHFRQAMKHLAKSPLEGFNVTVPYKETVMPFLDQLTPAAKAVGAVNTVFRKGGKWIGANTDVDGFLASLKQEGRLVPRGTNSFILGAGGAARAVAYALAREGAACICIANRHKARAQKIARDFRKQFPETKFNVLELKENDIRCGLDCADLVVNATSLGLKKEDKPLFPTAWIPSGRKLFVDLIYHRAQTPFLLAAKKKGHRTLNGLGMLLFQGAKAFEHWTGKKAPVEAMRKVLEG